MSDKVYVGFGFGPIQSGLFVYEAFRTGNFSRLVVAEIDQGMVDAVRAAGNRYKLNIARADRIDTVTVEGVELYNPNVKEDREKLVQAIEQADELGTALPSVKFYSLGESCAAKLCAEGINRRRTPKNTIFYTAENNNHAAEFFLEAVSQHMRPEHLAKFQALNTVIGKMSGIITDSQEVAKLGIATMAPASPKAILVEEFNRILITRITLDGFQRGITVLIEKDDLMPFEEAKLYGHNAIHAMMAYMGEEKGYATMSQIASDKEIIALARKAFIEDSGRPLCKKYASLGDELFTEAGYRAYAEDLLVRMVNPYLTDLISRVGRDHLRKLGRSDRLFGTMWLAIEQGFTPATIALGAAAGIRSMIRRQNEIEPKPISMPAKCEDLTKETMQALLHEIWGNGDDATAHKVIDLTWKAYIG